MLDGEIPRSLVELGRNSEARVALAHDAFHVEALDEPVLRLCQSEDLAERLAVVGRHGELVVLCFFSLRIRTDFVLTLALTFF